MVFVVSKKSKKKHARKKTVRKKCAIYVKWFEKITQEKKTPFIKKNRSLKYKHCH